MAIVNSVQTLTVNKAEEYLYEASRPAQLACLQKKEEWYADVFVQGAIETVKNTTNDLFHGNLDQAIQVLCTPHKNDNLEQIWTQINDAMRLFLVQDEIKDFLKWGDNATERLIAHQPIRGFQRTTRRFVNACLVMLQHEIKKEGREEVISTKKTLVQELLGTRGAQGTINDFYRAIQAHPDFTKLRTGGNHVIFLHKPTNKRIPVGPHQEDIRNGLFGRLRIQLNAIDQAMAAKENSVAAE